MKRLNQYTAAQIAHVCKDMCIGEIAGRTWYIVGSWSNDTDLGELFCIRDLPHPDIGHMVCNQFMRELDDIGTPYILRLEEALNNYYMSSTHKTERINLIEEGE